MVQMGEFAATLGRVLKRPALFRVPLPALRLVLGELADGVSPGQKVLPEKALAAGYRYRHPELEEALRACLGKG
jgi:NAD dependent epimerase/dehydratase family enzyme